MDLTQWLNETELLIEQLEVAANCDLRQNDELDAARVALEKHLLLRPEVPMATSPLEKAPVAVDDTYTPTVRDLTRLEITQAALVAGFSLSTGYGQEPYKMLPMTDFGTLYAFTRAVRRIK